MYNIPDCSWPQLVNWLIEEHQATKVPFYDHNRTPYWAIYIHDPDLEKRIYLKYPNYWFSKWQAWLLDYD